MKKLPFIILLAALSGVHLTACADDDAGKPQAAQAEAPQTESKQADTTAESKPAEGEQTAAADEAKPAEGEQAAVTDEAKPAENGEKKAASGGSDEPDCN